MPYYGTQARHDVLGLFVEIAGPDSCGQLGFVGETELR